MKSQFIATLLSSVFTFAFIASPAFATTDYPAGYTKLVKEPGSATFSGTRSVAFGASGKFVYKTLTGSVTCSVATFGSDPIPGKSKWCSIKNTTTTTPPPATTPPPTSGGGTTTPPPPTTSGSITGATCVSTGSVTVAASIEVTGTFDGGCKTYNATSALGSGDQSESQLPVFNVRNGATLKNVIIGTNGVDGIHVFGNATISNIKWSDVGEDGLTIKSSSITNPTVNISNITALNGSDKFFQVNTPATLHVTNGIITTMGKSFRQNGGTTYKTVVTFDRMKISNMSEGIFRTDGPDSTASITNSVLSNTKTMFIGYASGHTTSSGNTGN